MEICRLCFNSTSDLFIPLNIEDGSIQRKQLELIFPEIDLNVILSPVLCSNCSNTLDNVYLLRNTWLECEGKLKNYLESKPNLKNPNLFDVINEDSKSGVLKGYFDVEVTKTEITEIPEVELTNKDLTNDLNKDLSDDLNKNKNDVDLEKIKTEEVSICNNCNCIETDCKCTQNSCSICFKTYDTQFKLQRHKLRHDLNRPRSYVCDICPKSYYTKYDLNNHKASHSGLRTFSCDECTSTFNSKKGLYGHKYQVHLKKTETLESGVRCDFCLKVFNTLYLLRRHKDALHRTRLRKYVCDVCRKGFFTKATLIRHQATHNKSKEDDTIIKKTQTKTFECYLCNKKFTRKNNVAVHIQNVHSRTECTERTNIKRKRTPRAPNNLKCEYCERVFKRSCILTAHIRTHTGERPYKCDQCEMSFGQTIYLKNHIRSVHANEKPYSCEHCDKKFSLRRALLEHIRRIHFADTVPKNHKCTICGKAFHKPSELLLHVKWHTNDRQFNCDLCEKSFIDGGNLKNHRATHFDKQYKCEICGKDFYHAGSLRKHIKNHAKIE